MNIKQLRPKKNGRYVQGYINNQSCKKLFPQISHQPIIYRSSYERKFIYWLENSSRVKYWGSESIKIPYTYIDGTQHNYYPDYVIEMVNGDKYIVEIKPKNQTIKPINENTWAWKEYSKNMCKWAEARRFCDQHGIKFKILTEWTINQL